MRTKVIVVEPNSFDVEPLNGRIGYIDGYVSLNDTPFAIVIMDDDLTLRTIHISRLNVVKED